MRQCDSDWVHDFFAARARDWTPASAQYAARVLFAPFSRDSEVTRRCASILSRAELDKAETFITEEGKSHFKQRRAFRRYCGALALGLRGMRLLLSEIVFQETDKGRPYLPALPQVCFSFSACGFGFLGAWSSTHRIGIDLEDWTKNLEAAELAHRYFSAAEADAVERARGPARLRTFFHLWSLKEAALKSVGEGMPFGLDAFQFELTPKLRIVHAPEDHGGRGQFDLHMIEADNICAALVMQSHG